LLEHGIADGRTVTVLSHQVLYCQPGTGDHDDAQVLEVNTDLTAARSAEQALAESELRLRAQFAYSAVGQIIRGLDGRLVEVNAAHAVMLGQL
jgi:PAS domain-containing protein